MRRFIVTNPNLSVGRPGDVVSAKQLHMDDDQLARWVDAGYGVEIDSEPEGRDLQVEIFDGSTALGVNEAKIDQIDLPLDTMSKPELLELARDLDITGRSEMSKDELIQAIARA